MLVKAVMSDTHCSLVTIVYNNKKRTGSESILEKYLVSFQQLTLLLLPQSLEETVEMARASGSDDSWTSVGYAWGA